jgi:Amt family ammonium transporter
LLAEASIVGARGVHGEPSFFFGESVTMKFRRRFQWFILPFAGAALFYAAQVNGTIWGQKAQGADDAPAGEATATTLPANEVAAAPDLPPYFSGTNVDPNKPTWPDTTGGAAGVSVFTSPDGKGDVPAPDDKAYAQAAHNTYSINMVWVLIAGFLVMFMQAGFAMVEGGLCRAKNSAHTMAMNLMIYPLGCIAFWAYGFAFGWGNWFNAPVGDGWYMSLGPGLSLLNEGIGIGGEPNVPTYGLLGTKGFFLMGLDDVSVMALFFFMMVFMDTTATIPTGTMAERWSWKNFCLYGLWVALPYCVYANWVWGGGWLAHPAA